jgi:hypothetical protein
MYSTSSLVAESIIDATTIALVAVVPTIKQPAAYELPLPIAAKSQF